jgi:hypothetical protein
MPLDLSLPLVERYRESHHAVANMIAAGMTDSMIRRKTGISYRRLTLLKQSPSFQELIALKAQRVQELFDQNLDTYLDLGIGNMIRAEAMISDHLDASDESGELLPVGVLDRISQGRADRFGYSKHAVLHHDHSFADQLERAVQRSGLTIEAQAEPPQALPAPVEAHVDSPPRKASETPPDPPVHAQRSAIAESRSFNRVLTIRPIRAA